MRPPLWFVKRPHTTYCGHVLGQSQDVPKLATKAEVRRPRFETRGICACEGGEHGRTDSRDPPAWTAGKPGNTTRSPASLLHPAAGQSHEAQGRRGGVRRPPPPCTGRGLGGLLPSRECEGRRIAIALDRASAMPRQTCRV